MWEGIVYAAADTDADAAETDWKHKVTPERGDLMSNKIQEVTSSRHLDQQVLERRGKSNKYRRSQAAGIWTNRSWNEGERATNTGGHRQQASGPTGLGTEGKEQQIQEVTGSRHLDQQVASQVLERRERSNKYRRSQAAGIWTNRSWNGGERATNTGGHRQQASGPTGPGTEWKEQQIQEVTGSRHLDQQVLEWRAKSNKYRRSQAAGIWTNRSWNGGERATNTGGHRQQASGPTGPGLEGKEQQIQEVTGSRHLDQQVLEQRGKSNKYRRLQAAGIWTNRSWNRGERATNTGGYR